MPGHFTFYSNQIEGDMAWFSEAEAKHAIQVLRYGVGEKIEFTNGLGIRFEGEIATTSKKDFSAKITSRVEENKPNSIHLFMGVLKAGDRMEWAVEKCTELGVETIVFVSTKNSERAKVNLERMNKVAMSAMKQSHGAFLPEILQLTFDESMRWGDGKKSNKVIAYCEFAEMDQAEKIKDLALPAAVFIGPEGDFTREEVEKAYSNGWKILMLGDQILRSETAAVSVTAALRMLHL